MTFDESSGDRTLARSSEAMTREFGNLTSKFDQLLEVCQSNLLEIQKIKAGGSMTVDSKFKPAVNSTSVQKRESETSKVGNKCYTVM